MIKKFWEEKNQKSDFQFFLVRRRYFAKMEIDNFFRRHLEKSPNERSPNDKNLNEKSHKSLHYIWPTLI